MALAVSQDYPPVFMGSLHFDQTIRSEGSCGCPSCGLIPCLLSLAHTSGLASCACDPRLQGFPRLVSCSAVTLEILKFSNDFPLALGPANYVASSAQLLSGPTACSCPSTVDRPFLLQVEV